MGDKISKSLLYVVVGLIASIITIVVFITGKSNIFSLLDNSTSTFPVESDSQPTQPSPSATIDDSLFLDASLVHYPSLSNSDYVVGGVWKLQGMHSDVFSFSQSVEIISLDNPNEKCYGYISCNTVWNEYTDGSWEIKEDELDELARFDYPKGTYGTFVIDFSSESFKTGKYICKLDVYINQNPYETTIELEIID